MVERSVVEAELAGNHWKIYRNSGESESGELQQVLISHLRTMRTDVHQLYKYKNHHVWFFRVIIRCRDMLFNLNLYLGLYPSNS
jgi:hypothetical protein